MQYNFLNIFLDKKDLLTKGKNSISQILLDNNFAQIEDIYNFYRNDSKLLYVNGFLGTGKVQIVNYSLSFLSSEAIVLKYNCFESTILDDILLSFFAEFKKLSAQNVISEPKVKTENFSQKINSYFSKIEKPFVIILDSFESILKENRQEILDFITHLGIFPKIKIILISRTFEIEYFASSDIKYDRISTHALEKSIFEKYLKEEKIKFTNSTLEEFYKFSRGYYFYTTLAISLMKQSNVNLSDFLTDFNNSFLTFDDFLMKEALELVLPAARNLFWFLSLLRHSATLELLKILNLYDEAKISNLADNFILTQDRAMIYVQDYLKERINTTISPHIAQRIHQYIVELYQTQLPLKPLERNILLSRQTIRKEIEYHQIFLPKKLKNIENPNIDINYLTYSKGFDFEQGHFKSRENEPEQKPEKMQGKSPKYVLDDLPSFKNINLNLSNLPFQQSGEEQQKNINISDAQEEPVIPEEELSWDEIMSNIKAEESSYNYKKIIDLYQKAILLADNTNYQAQLPMIYKNIAYAYHKVSNYDSAIKYYNFAQESYEKSDDLLSANNIKLSKSKIYYETYKLEKAKEILFDILKFKENPSVIFAQAYLQLANIEDSLSNVDESFNYYKLAIDNSDETMGVEILSELYFKYALSLDDKNDIKSAIEFYEKCINLGDGGEQAPNKFLSSAYSNIANLYLEKNDISSAVKYYLKAFDVDKKNNNNDGMYYSSSKLASVLQKKYPQEAVKYFKTALESAKLLNDIFYVASASLAIGDFYYDKREDEVALGYYVDALDFVKDEFSKENINKIQIRINDIKFRMGVEAFENIMRTKEGNK